MSNPIVDRFILGFQKGMAMYWHPFVTISNEVRKLCHLRTHHKKRQHA